MKIKLLLIVVTAGMAMCGCEQKPVPEYKPPSAEEMFKDAEANGLDGSDGVGRFVPIHISDKIAILDSKLGNVFYYDFDKKEWAKISSPLASNSFKQPNYFDLIPTASLGFVPDTHDPLGIDKK